MPITLDETIRPLPIRLGTEPEQIGENIAKNLNELQAEGQKIILETDLKTPKSIQDEAVLSKESQSPKETERIRAFMERWNIENSPLWQLLLNWDPTAGGGSVEGKLQQLMELYQALLAEVLANTSGSNQQMQLVLLESALSTALNRYMEASFKELSVFFEYFGKSEQLEHLKSEVYRAVTGHRLSPKEMKQFWKMGAEGNGSKAGSGQNAAEHQMGAMNSKGGERWTRFSSAPQGTVIYQPGKKAGEILAETLPEMPAAGKTSGKGVNQTMTQTQGEVSIRDMSLSKQFVTYAESEKSPFALGTRGFGNKSEELKGVLASILQIQCREFSKGAKIGDTMSHILLDGVDRYIDKEIRDEELLVNRQNQHSSFNSGQTTSHPRQFQYNNVYKIYNYILGLYDKYRQPERAISEGIRHAVVTYQQRSKEDMDIKEGELRFFKVGNTGQQITFWADLKEAKILLEKNWGHFLAYTVYDGKKRREVVSLLPLDKGFWGMCIKPDSPELSMFYKHYLYLFIGVMVFGLIVLLLLRG